MPRANRLRRLTGLKFGLARLAGGSRLSFTLLLFIAAAVAWLAAVGLAASLIWIAGGCALTSLRMAAYPRGCRKCGATSSLTGALPLLWIGAGFYALLTLCVAFGTPEATRTAFLTASGANAALVAILFRERIACYPCLATAAMAWSGLAVAWTSNFGTELLVLPAVMAATAIAVGRAKRAAAVKDSALFQRLQAQVFAEHVTPGQARLVIYSTVETTAPFCVYFKTVIRPALEDSFGDALVCDDRDAANLPVGVRIFFVSGGLRTTLSAIATDEMYPHLSAAIESAMMQAWVP